MAREDQSRRREGRVADRGVVPLMGAKETSQPEGLDLRKIGTKRRGTGQGRGASPRSSPPSSIARHRRPPGRTPSSPIRTCADPTTSIEGEVMLVHSTPDQLLALGLHGTAKVFTDLMAQPSARKALVSD
jgi:hypothetical protein